jgi:hypothetical protein
MLSFEIKHSIFSILDISKETFCVIYQKKKLHILQKSSENNNILFLDDTKKNPTVIYSLLIRCKRKTLCYNKQQIFVRFSFA